MRKKLSVLILPLVLLSGCTGATSEAVVNTDKAIAIGQEAADKLMQKLQGELKQALGQGGPVSGVTVCSQTALNVTDEMEKQIGDGIVLKRTSFKYRNPLNAPDEYEKEALNYFETALGKGEKLPEYYVQEVKGEQSVRYYKPLAIADACMSCHGPVTSMNQNLVAQLKETYPEDKATDYKVGDFRGVVRVSIPEQLTNS